MSGKPAEFYCVAAVCSPDCRYEGGRENRALRPIGQMS
jgi:hypothetical protein